MSTGYWLFLKEEIASFLSVTPQSVIYDENYCENESLEVIQDLFCFLSCTLPFIINRSYE